MTDIECRSCGTVGEFMKTVELHSVRTHHYDKGKWIDKGDSVPVELLSTVRIVCLNCGTRAE